VSNNVQNSLWNNSTDVFLFFFSLSLIFFPSRAVGRPPVQMNEIESSVTVKILP